MLRHEESLSDVDIEDVRPHLQERFPWHSSDNAHTDVSSPEEWWEQLCPLFADILNG